MIVTPVDPGIKLAQPAEGYVRGEGLHMSTLIHALYEDLEPKRYRTGKPMNDLHLTAGLALEEFFEQAIREKLTPGSGRPGEGEYNHHGTTILFSPDLLLFNGSVKVGEIKCTWLSMKGVPREPGNGFPPKFAKYITQIACYCYMLETAHAQLVTFAVNGNYKFLRKKKDKLPDGPELLAWDIVFSARELHEEWSTVINNAHTKRLL